MNGYLISLAQWARLSEYLNSQDMAYDFKASRNDGFVYENQNADGLSSYHVHTIEWVDASGDNMAFQAILPKSGSFRNGDEPDLAQLDVTAWAGACQGMDSSTIKVVKKLAEFFTLCNATQPVNIGTKPVYQF